MQFADDDAESLRSTAVASTIASAVHAQPRVVENNEYIDYDLLKTQALENSDVSLSQYVQRARSRDAIAHDPEPGD